MACSLREIPLYLTTIMNTPTLPPLIMGGAGFSYQLHPEPASLPIVNILQRAFDLGIRTIDTSPYYAPSEELLGAALSDPAITATYPRHTYQIMTKCGRIAANHFDYSPSWIRQSVTRSLQRFNTTYLDVVFCHDVEFVSASEAVVAVGILLELKDAGLIRFVGISGYDLPCLLAVAQAVRAKYSRSIDVVQNWAQLSLQNTRLLEYLEPLRATGVRAVCNASPMASGLLRKGSVPVGTLGDWHPAPTGLRAVAAQASDWIELEHGKDGRSLVEVALQYAVVQSMRVSRPEFAVSTITGISTIPELEQNVTAVERVLKSSRGAEPRRQGESTRDDGLLDRDVLNEEAATAVEPLFQGVRKILADWIGYDFSTPQQSIRRDVAAAEVEPPVSGAIDMHSQTGIVV